MPRCPRNLLAAINGYDGLCEFDQSASGILMLANQTLTTCITLLRSLDHWAIGTPFMYSAQKRRAVQYTRPRRDQDVTDHPRHYLWRYT